MSDRLHREVDPMGIRSATAPERYEPLTYPDSPATMEALAAWLHTVYQDEAKRQAGFGADQVRHPDAYDQLPEHTKDYDRALAIFILEEIAAPNQVREMLDELGG